MLGAVRMNDDDLMAAAELVFEFLDTERDWDRTIDHVGWTGRQTVAHLAEVSMNYTLALGGRWTSAWPTMPSVDPGTEIGQLLTLARAGTAALDTVISTCPADVRAFHATGMADPDGFAAMMVDELLVHASDVAATHGETLQPPSDLVRRLLDRLFPWWPQEVDPWSALLWANGRSDLPNSPGLGEAWVWHSAPVAHWDGDMPLWDSEKNAIVSA